MRINYFSNYFTWLNMCKQNEIIEIKLLRQACSKAFKKLTSYNHFIWKGHQSLLTRTNTLKMWHCSSIFISNKFVSIPGNGGGLVGQAGAVKKIITSLACFKHIKSHYQ